MPFVSLQRLADVLVLSVTLLVLFGPLHFVPRAQAQEDAGGKTAKTIGTVAKATDSSIPSAPAFALMDVSPANVHTPAYPRDFKVDWIVNDDELASNIAIQAAPVWIFGFENVSASEYRTLNPVVQQLSSLELSAATTQQASNRVLAVAAKLNLFDAADPLEDAPYTTNLSNALSFSEKQTTIQNKLEKAALQTRASISPSQAQDAAIETLVDAAGKFGPFNPEEVTAYRTLSPEEKRPLRSLVSELTLLYEDLQDVSPSMEQRLKTLKRRYEREHWNAFRLDLAGGRVLQYDTPQLDSLSLTSKGWGGWMTGAWGFGTDRLLATGMARAITADTGLGDNQARYFVGVNLRYRYGSSLDNAFVEYIRRFGNRPNRHEIAYGGSLDLTERLNVQFGLRTAYDDDLELRDLRPTVKINGNATDLLGAL